MRDHLSQEMPENASLSRRRFLAGAVALPTVAAVPVAVEVAAAGDELAWLIDGWRESRAQQDVPGNAMDDILARTDCPAPGQPGRKEFLETANLCQLETQFNELLDRQFMIEDRICAYPCRSLSDMAMKIAFAEEAFFGEGEREDRYVAILTSMRDFLAAVLPTGAA